MGPESLRGEEGGRQADGDREYRGTTQESDTLTPDDKGGPGWAGHSSALKGQSAGCDVSRYTVDGILLTNHKRFLFTLL